MSLNMVFDQAEATYRMEVHSDPDTENPTEYGILQFAFDTRAPDWDWEWTYCSTCLQPSDFELHDPNMEGRALFSIHDFTWHPAVIGVIGSSGWLGELPVDYAEFDANVGEGLVVVRDEHREYWDGLTEREQQSLQSDIAEEYHLWATGNTYWASIERIVRDTCGSCDRKLDDEEVDSCGGFIGDVAVEDWAEDIVGQEPIYVKEIY